ncbi:MAG TPA: nitroreductase family protein [Coriobacteriia bacterium]|nr:nitroreductase family protein [Coriobacteriia bacterium]
MEHSRTDPRATLSMPDAPVARWLESAETRTSRRSFDGTPLTAAELDELRRLPGAIRPHPDARVLVASDAPERVFRGIAGSYGRITGASAIMLFAASTHSPSALTAIGYTGEAAILEATALGFATCWVAGLFNDRVARSVAEVAPHERILAITPVGHPAPQVTGTERLVYGMRKPKRRKRLDEIAPGFGSGDWPTWVRGGVEAARIAPSAYNRQPWRFRVEGESVIVSFAGPERVFISKRVDCGIAMLHFELGARAAGSPGSWELLAERSDVARFVLDATSRT